MMSVSSPTQTATNILLKNPWSFGWNKSKAVRLDHERPERYEELRKDARMLCRDLEEWHGEYDHPRGQSLSEMISGVVYGRPAIEPMQLSGKRLPYEFMSRPVVRELFTNVGSEGVYFLTNNGLPMPLMMGLDPHSSESDVVEAEPLLMSSHNSTLPNSADEAFIYAKRNRMIWRSTAKSNHRPRSVQPTRMWQHLESRTPEDALLFCNFNVRQGEPLAEDLFNWARHACEASAKRLSRRIVEGSLNEENYRLLTLDPDFREFLKETC